MIQFIDTAESSRIRSLRGSWTKAFSPLKLQMSEMVVFLKRVKCGILSEHGEVIAAKRRSKIKPVKGGV